MSKSIVWRSPSNIALVKYWGKHGVQLPNNPSLSLTLDKCYTEMKIIYEASEELEVELYFDKIRNPRFEMRAKRFLETLVDVFPFLLKQKIVIYSSNSFPHSAGIASSASSMSALALCVCKMEEEITGEKLSEDEFYQKVSQIARRGSGSASRSVYGGFVLWGKTPDLITSSDLYAVSVPEVNDEFKEWSNAIMVVHSGVKHFSSTLGHKMMQENPFGEIRYDAAMENTGRMLSILKSGDVDEFIELVEKEALMLHALMMTSGKGYFEMRPNSLNIMNAIRNFRRDTGIPIAFTLDAGPNVHLLYPSESEDQVKDLISNRLETYCENKYWINDRIGNGPSLM